MLLSVTYTGHVLNTIHSSFWRETRHNYLSLVVSSDCLVENLSRIINRVTQDLVQDLTFLLRILEDSLFNDLVQDLVRSVAHCRIVYRMWMDSL